MKSRFSVLMIAVVAVVFSMAAEAAKRPVRVLEIKGGGYHSCALLETRALKCWGYNGAGQLGQENVTNLGSAANSMGDNLPAIKLGNKRTVKSFSTGYQHTCAILDNNQLK